MIASVVRKEWRLLLRDGRAKAAITLILLLALAATLSSWSSVSELASERSAAQVMDREIWDRQGDKNPHTAAHFSRYAFKPTFSLAVFDPGLTSFTGNAIWLEAHYRDPAALRPVEDAVEIQRMADLTPAWVVQVFGPLLIILLMYSSVAQERESGTLRLALSAGARPRALLVGKAILPLVLVIALVIVVLLGGATFVALGGYRVLVLPDTAERIAGLALAYSFYLAVFVLLSLGVSALSARSRSALGLLLGLWALSVVLAPRVAVDVGAALSPAPPVPEFASRLSEESSEPFWGGSDEAAALRQQVTDGVLKEYGVAEVEDLPINLDGFLLQESEEYANVVFDRLYGDLRQGYERQSEISRYLSVISPTIALQNVSAALSGTDLYAHWHHADAAERFRRDFVRILNQEMIDHGGNDGYAYQAGNEFWERTPDFEYTPPGFGQALRGVGNDLTILFVWMLAAGAFMTFAVRRGMLAVTST